MFKILFLFSLIFVLVVNTKSETSWGSFDLVNIWLCPNPNLEPVKEKTVPLTFQSNLPYTLINGPNEKWCLKKYCSEPQPYTPGVEYNTMYDYTLNRTSIMIPLSNIRTNYVKGLIGFNIELVITIFKIYLFFY